MGNHHSHGGINKGDESAMSSGASSHSGSRKGMSRSSSGADIQEKTSSLIPVEKLAKILCVKCQHEEGVNGITLLVFTRYLFPRYPLFAEKLYNYLHQHTKSKLPYMSVHTFKQQCEKYLAIIDDDTVRDTLVKMFSCSSSENDNYMMSCESFRSLLMCAYHVSMDHYSEGPQMCLGINKTLKSVVDSCFHAKTTLSYQFISHWIETNCPRLLLPLHRFAVHALATSYRNLEAGGPEPVAGLELATPVLEQLAPFGKHVHPYMLQMSMSWLLAGALSPIYSRPQKAHSPSNSGVGLASQIFMSKLLCAVPSHWMILYNSEEMGVGANRFMHHVLAYKGPTICILKAEAGPLFCIASPNEWKESNLYWGDVESTVVQLWPKFLLIEKGAKMLYLNMSVRGYPHGLRAGKDPRKPIISIDAGFERMEYCRIPYALERIEVWGCGDQASRDTQLDIKKWQIKEVEKQRSVKLSASEWLDHPDRYLLELAGRPQYHQNSGQQS